MFLTFVTSLLLTAKLIDLQSINEFDLKAADWDKNPMHWDRSVAIAGAIMKKIPLKNSFRALEYGAGTGILSFLLKDHLREIVLMDNSSEMIRMINEKVAATQVKTLQTMFFDLEHSDFTDGKFDLVFTQMVLHHVSDIDNILTKFHDLLNPGGFLAIADMYSEDGSFHGDGFNGHKGFDAEHLSNQILKKGFSNLSLEECFVIKRQVSETETKEYPVFLIIAEKVTG
jgi:ubiquinone/menaquinone biosynthesis C-methylase UbiE